LRFFTFVYVSFTPSLVKEQIRMRSSHDMIFSGFSRSVLSAAVALVVAAPALAQNTTAAIGGQVTGADGKPVAGAAVSILHVESGSSNKLVTDAEGRYSARGLRVGGPYTIVVTKGNDKETRDGVYLQLAESLPLDLKLGSVALQAVTVTGAASSKFNSSSMGSGTNIGRQELNTFASVQRSLNDYARMDPRLSQTEKDRGEISAAGQNSRYNSLTIDGMRTNDTFGLEANGLPTIKQPISIDAIQAVQVNLSNYDVTQQGYTGANINAVTKSGTNEFKGSVYTVYRDNRWQGERYNRTNGTYTAAPFSRETTNGFVLGGPLIEDKLFFFTSFEELRSNRNAPTFGPMGSSLINVGITPAQIDAARDAAMSRYGVDVGLADIPSSVQTAVKDALFKVDWNISENHRANFRYAKTKQSDPIFPGNFNNALALSSYWYVTEKTIDTMVGQWFGDWSDTFSTEVKVSSRNYSSVPLLNANTPEVSLVYTTPAPAGTASGDRTLRFGTEETRQYNDLQTKTTNLFAAGNLTLNDHEIKGGVDFERNKIINAFVRRASGQYTFRGTDPVALFLAGNPTTYQVQVPLPGHTLQDGAADWTMTNTGVFLQDTWKVNKQLTFTGGVRVDVLGTNDRPIANPAASAPMVAGNPATGTRQSGGFGYDNTQTLDGEKLFQPRLGFNLLLDAEEKSKSQLRGGFGLFQGSAANVWLTNPFQTTGAAVTTFACGTSGNPACPADLRINFDPRNQPSISSVPPAPAVDFIAPGVSQPSVLKANLAWDAALPWGNMVFGAEILHTDVRQGLYYKHLNLGAPTGIGPDGRQLFWNAGGLNPACYNGDATPLTTGACATGSGRPTSRALSNLSYANATLVDKTSEGGGNALTLSLSGAIDSSMRWSTAYTRTTATEVSPLTSSTANSNFANRAVFNPNEEVAANSAYLVRNRLNASFNATKSFIQGYKTTFGLFYEGKDGRPFSWTFNNDMNGDGVVNDLLYIPSGRGSGQVLFRGPAGSTMTAAQAEEKFWTIVDANASLSESKGSVVSRNSAFSPITHQFDVRISQEVPGFFPKHKGVLSLDILNIGNLINKEWGRIDEVTFQDGRGANTRNFVNFAGIDPATGRMIYAVNDPSDLTTKQAKGESQWALQVTLKYEF
jgi:hypothetical protein